MEIKVCGLKEPRNIAEVAALGPDYMGFIFYRDSPRYAGRLPADALRALPAFIRKIGVFVDEDESEIIRIAAHYVLDGIQLHGSESPETCRALSRIVPVIKAVSVRSGNDLRKAARYEGCCSALLFDTRHRLRGGSGEQFDWEILGNYTAPTPFFLSGGIGPGDADRLRTLAHPRLRAIDLNSRFETSPGLKDTGLLGTFFSHLKQTTL